MPHFARLLIVLASAWLLPHTAQAGENLSRGARLGAAPDADLVDRFIVKLRTPANDPRPALNAIGGTFGERLDPVRAMSGGSHVVRLGRRVSRAEAHDVARLLRGDARIARIEPDLVMHPLIVPNDTMYAQQWHYHEAQGGINLPTAWDRSTGATGITVAVIDTGVVAHVDLAGRLATGYDFILRTSGGGDPGDYGCNGAPSSWHGTHVAGTIGAASNNSSGVAGANWVSKILPVRVLGRCGGYTSDIVDGMRWAAGIDVPGVPTNPTPARVENLSLGGDGACSAAFQSAVNDVIARGTVVVVAAGNGNVDASGSQPASCSGVIAVSATTRNGGRAGYSNYGAKVTIAAPGGGNGDGVLSTVNAGTTTPGADGYAYFQGTSMAAPHVSGVVSLMLSIDSTLTPAQVMQRVQQSARAFPGGTGADCNVSLCGAGIVDAAATLAAIVAPPVPPPPTPGWTRIADEGQAFTVAGTQTVRYGSEPYWITKSVSNAGECTNAYFATDPIFGIRKSCEVAAGTPSPPPSGWTKIATEGQSFALSGTQTVRYGSGTSWVAKSVMSSGVCTNAFFGIDPIFGVLKECDVAGTAPPAPLQWTQVAVEGQSFTVTGTQTVRYGAGSSWVTKSVTSGGACTNAFFGSDPIYGVVKHCDVQQ